jgi:multiple sugar transport system substrate-binding protein/raffinose/stachyose/melibiose transport system substrate-binding protein
MKRSYIQSLSIIIIFLTIISNTACQKSTENEKATLHAKGSITALLSVAEIPEAYQTIADNFMKKYPEITVDIQTMPGSVTEALQAKAASDSLPDIMSINADPFGDSLANEGKLADLSSTEAWKNMLDSLKSQWISKSGVHYGISGGLASTLIYYNKSLFNKAGITELPTNWDEFIKVCDKLKSVGITPLILEGSGTGCIANCWYSYGLAIDVVSKVPDFKELIIEGKFDFNTQKMADVFNRIKFLVDSGYVNKDYMSTDYNGGLQMFTQGKAAMIFNGTWVGGTVTGLKDFETGAFLPPINASGQKIVPVLVSETGWAVSEKGNKDAAIMFLEYLNGEGFIIYQNARGNVPHMIAAKIKGDVKISPVLKSIVDDISRFDMSIPLSFAYMPAVVTGNTDKIIQEVLLGNTTPMDAAKQIDDLSKLKQ